MDLIVSGGGGAPIYTYTGEPKLEEYLKANEASKVELKHLVKPSVDAGLNPYHYLLVRVDGENLDMQVIAWIGERDLNRIGATRQRSKMSEELAAGC